MLRLDIMLPRCSITCRPNYCILTRYISQVLEALEQVLATAPPPPDGRPWRLLFTG